MSDVPVTSAPEAAPTESPTQTTPAEQAEIRKYRLKVDGQDLEVDEEELKRGYRMREVSDRRMNDAHKAKLEALREKEQASQFWNRVETDPEGALAELEKKNPKLAEAMEKILWKKIQAEQMSPEDRARMQRDEELRDREARIKAKEEAEAEAEEAKHTAVQRQHTERAIIQALERSGLPPTEETVGLMAAYINRALQAKFTPNMSVVVEQVRNHMTRNAARVLGKLPAAELKKMLGPEVMKALRDHDLGEVRGSQREARPKQVETKPRNGDTSERRLLSEREWEQKVLGNA